MRVWIIKVTGVGMGWGEGLGGTGRSGGDDRNQNILYEKNLFSRKEKFL